MTAPLLDRLRDVKCDQVGFTPEHAKCICRLANEAADAVLWLKSRDLRHKIVPTSLRS